MKKITFPLLSYALLKQSFEVKDNSYCYKNLPNLFVLMEYGGLKLYGQPTWFERLENTINI